MGSDNGSHKGDSISFQRILFVLFGIAALSILAFRSGPDESHHHHGGAWEAEGQAHHSFVKNEEKDSNKADSSLFRPSEWLPETRERDGYDHLDFEELPGNAVNAALVLGYTPEMWDNGVEDPPVFFKPWSKLTAAEKDAAATLGYHEDAWREDYESDDYDEMEYFYGQLDFEELPGNAVNAALALGYTAETWDRNEDPPVFSKPWSELTAAEKDALGLLGYSEYWDEDSEDREQTGSGSDDEGSESEEEAVFSYNNYEFWELPPKAKDAAVALGYTAEMWDNGDEDPPVFSKPWSKLTAAEKDAVEVLGYSKNNYSWGEDSGDEEQTGSGSDDEGSEAEKEGGESKEEGGESEEEGGEAEEEGGEAEEEAESLALPRISNDSADSENEEESGSGSDDE